MPLATGTKLGRYEIVGLLGAGGMGEVYRARDTRLGRAVAVKVLPRGMASDPERRQRFEAEARAAGSLNHPNIVTLHDVGVADGLPYLVTEVLEGESLRAVILQGAVPIARAVDLIVDLANGLSAAHAKGIVHRDLKPENLFVLSDGRLKILDFGIAKLTRPDPAVPVGPDAETTPVFASLTAAGTIMGTVSYMAPEQLRDRPVDQRADLFAVGAILHELLTGKQPFTGEAAADRVSAILLSDPPPLPASIEAEVPGIGAVVSRLLAKRPEGRFHSAVDLAFTLSLLKGRPAPRDSAGALAGSATPARIEFWPLTYRDGEIGAARFAPDGQTIVYDAAWGGGKSEVYLCRIESPESSPLGVGNANVQAVSATAEVAVILRPKDVGGFVSLGTLARLPLVGGRPREVVDGAYSADWSPDGRNLAAIRFVDGTCQIEAPVGRVIHTTLGWMSHLRYSPDGSMLAFLDHPSVGSNAGYACVIRPGEPPRRLTEWFDTIWRLAWRPDGKEIWFGVHMGKGNAMSSGGVTLEGARRTVFTAPGWAAVMDVARNGDALLAMTRPRMRLEAGTRSGGPASTTDLSHLDWSLLRDLSPDGSVVLFDESGMGSAGHPGIYVRSIDGGPAVRLADGICSTISRDGRAVLGWDLERPGTLLVVPTGVGETRSIDLGDYTIAHASWAAGSDSVVLVASKPNGPRILYHVDLATRAIRPIGDGIAVVGTQVQVSGDGRRVAVRDPGGGIRVVELDDGSSRMVPGFDPALIPAAWDEDATKLFVWARDEIPNRVHRVDVKTGVSEPWMEIRPMTRSGAHGLNSLDLTPDGERYAYSYVTVDATLFLARGLS